MITLWLIILCFQEKQYQTQSSETFSFLSALVSFKQI